MPDTGYKVFEQDIDDSFLTKEYLSLASFNAGSMWMTGAAAAIVGLRSSPVQINGNIYEGGNKQWKEIACADHYLCAIKTNGTLWQWNISSTAGTIPSSPVQITGGGSWKKICAGGRLAQSSSLAIKSDSTLWEIPTRTRSTPVLLSSDVSWAYISVCSEPTSRHVLGISNDNKLYVWGNGDFGKLGRNESGSNNTIAQIGSSTWRQGVCGEDHTLAIKTDGTLWAWGSNQLGELGTNDAQTNHRSSPVQVGSSTNWKQVAAYFYSSSAIKTDGTLWGWGDNDYSADFIPFSASRRSSPTQVGSSTNWKQIATNGMIAGVKTDGTLWTWGTTSVSGFNNSLGIFTNKPSYGNTISASSFINISYALWSCLYGNITSQS
jgi:alpha-tubulin suppressor-like RCC1 family protein